MKVFEIKAIQTRQYFIRVEGQWFMFTGMKTNQPINPKFQITKQFGAVK